MKPSKGSINETPRETAWRLINTLTPSMLLYYLNQGVAIVSKRGEIEATASDGNTVNFGLIISKQDVIGIESYLQEYNTPDKW